MLQVLGQYTLKKSTYNKGKGDCKYNLNLTHPYIESTAVLFDPFLLYVLTNTPFVDSAVIERVEEDFAAGIHHCHPHPEGYSVGGH